MSVAPNSEELQHIRPSCAADRCTRQEWRMRIGVLLFVLFTGSVAVATHEPLRALWTLCGLVPFGLLCRMPADERRKLSRQFFGP
jgi:hypothetical protein